MRASYPWSPEQDAVLLANAELPERELARMVNACGPQRSPSAARKRLRRLMNDAPKPRSSAWSDEEMDIVKRLYPTTSDEVIVKSLTIAGFSRTREAVKGFRQRYGLVQPNETEEREINVGWKPLAGDFAERDRLFLRKLWTEQLRIVRERAGQAA